MKYLAIEAGATHSLAALYTGDGTLLAEAEGGPCNPTAYGWDASIRVLVELGNRLLPVERGDVVLLAGIAGAVNDKARRTAAQRLCAGLGISEARVTEDLYPILHANAGTGPALLAIGGTGSNAIGCNALGDWAQVGGRGHVFGDEGSAYAIGVAALRAVAEAEDGLGPETMLAQALVRATGGEHTSDLIAWAGAATKRDLAHLTYAVLETADAGDAVAAACVSEQARLLARQVAALMHKLEITTPAPVYGHGGLFEKCPRYRAGFEKALSETPLLHLETPRHKGPRAVFELSSITAPSAWLAIHVEAARVAVPVDAAASSPTEGLAQTARPLDELDAHAMTAAMTGAGLESAQSVAHAVSALTPLVEAAGACLRGGGRILYVGAGTSGRLGVLDAAECPPTFGVDSARVQGIIAGGIAALTNSIEGAEDDTQAGAAAIDAAQVSAQDIVIGVAASGNTPYVAGALCRATELGAPTGLITSNPNASTPARFRVNLDTGPELVSGSTRLKAGTAAKIALNIVSTGAMALSGFVHQGRMIGMRPVNLKLRERAARIVAELAPCEIAEAVSALGAVEYNIAAAILVARKACDAPSALSRARQASSPLAALQGPDRQGA
jgi:N-acetylmuramic acid 6-phosphate etherase